MDIQRPADIMGADCGNKNHLMTGNGKRAHNPRSSGQRKQHRKHQHHIAGKPRNSKRRQHAVAKHREHSRRYGERRDQELHRQMRNILLAVQPKLVAVESLHPISMMASAPWHCRTSPATIPKPSANSTKAWLRWLYGHVGKFLREEAAKLGIPTVSVPPQGTSQTCPNCGHRNNRESQAVFRCRTCGLYAHSDWTASVIIRNRAYVRYCEWRSGETPSVEDAPTGWREQPSRSGRQMRLPGLSVFKLKGNATSSRGSRVRGPKPDRRIQSGGLRRRKSEALSLRCQAVYCLLGR